MDNIQVAVRLRPLNKREISMNAKSIITMDKSTQQTIIENPEDGKTTMFAFDYSYNSSLDPSDENFCSQQTIWNDIGVNVLAQAYKGFNVSLFAYGQTGSGKSYSMMGYPPTPLNEGSGIIPIACSKIFEKINSNNDVNLTYRVQCSMMEIYMERVRDLFNPSAGYLKVRQHAKLGFYVENLTKNAVNSFEQIEKMMDEGTKARTVANTNMNSTSSRAHTIFQIILTQTKKDISKGKAVDIEADINLIDLAGSERADSTGATGETLKQGSAINQSLSSLGNVISSLVQAQTDKKVIIPYRASVLTMLLKNSLGGNAKTFMIAALSPADVNYAETLSTLQYANRAKQIKNKPVINEDPNEKLVKSLKAEIELLKKQQSEENGKSLPGVDTSGMLENERKEYQEKMELEKKEELKKLKEQMESLEKENAKSWEMKLVEAQQRAKSLALLSGVDISLSPEEMESKKKKVPYLINLHEDDAFTGNIVHFLEEGNTYFGRKDAVKKQNVVLGGLSIQSEHCIFGNDDGIVLIKVMRDAKVTVNGKHVETEAELKCFDRVVLGHNHVFVYCLAGTFLNEAVTDDNAEIDYKYAVKEVNEAQVAALRDADFERAQQAEKERQDTEKKLKKMEEAMAKEKIELENLGKEKLAKLEADMQARIKKQNEDLLKKSGNEQELKMKFEKEKKKFEEESLKAKEDAEKKLKDLEDKLQKQIKETEALEVKKEKERISKSLLDEQILRTIPLITEANGIGKELNKNVSFDIKLVGNNSENDEASDIVLWIRATIADGTHILWTLGEFTDRLYNMREIFQRFDEARELKTDNLLLEGEVDPFEIKLGEQLIGKSLIYLNSLGFLLEIEEATPIISYTGSQEGELIVSIYPHLLSAKGEKISAEDLEDENIESYIGRKIQIDVKVTGARGLPAKYCSQVYSSYKWFNEKEKRVTDKCPQRTINPKINHECSTTHVIIDDFCKYVRRESLQFDVYGSADIDRNASALQTREEQKRLEQETKIKQVQEEMMNQMITNEMHFQAKLEQTIKEASENEAKLKEEKAFEHEEYEREKKAHDDEKNEANEKMRKMEEEIQKLKMENEEILVKSKKNCCIVS